MNSAGNESRSTQSGMGGVSSSKSQKEMFTCSVWGGGPVGPGAESDIVLCVIVGAPDGRDWLSLLII